MPLCHLKHMCPKGVLPLMHLAHALPREAYNTLPYCLVLPRNGRSTKVDRNEVPDLMKADNGDRASVAKHVGCEVRFAKRREERLEAWQSTESKTVTSFKLSIQKALSRNTPDFCRKRVGLMRGRLFKVIDMRGGHIEHNIYT